MIWVRKPGITAFFWRFIGWLLDSDEIYYRGMRRSKWETSLRRNLVR